MTMKLDWMRGCATALVTPFTSDGSIDEERLRALVDRQINGGVKLLVPCGTTGESATMTEDEDARVIGITIEVARGRAKVIAGAGSNSTAAAIDYSKRARDAGADAVLQVAPWYNKPTQEGLYAHFRAIAEAIPPTPPPPFLRQRALALPHPRRRPRRGARRARGRGAEGEAGPAKKGREDSPTQKKFSAANRPAALLKTKR